MNLISLHELVLPDPCFANPTTFVLANQKAFYTCAIGGLWVNNDPDQFKQHPATKSCAVSQNLDQEIRSIVSQSDCNIRATTCVEYPPYS